MHAVPGRQLVAAGDRDDYKAALPRLCLKCLPLNGNHALWLPARADGWYQILDDSYTSFSDGNSIPCPSGAVNDNPPTVRVASQKNSCARQP